MLPPFFLFVFLLTSVDINRSAALPTVWLASPRLPLAYSVVIARGGRAESSRNQQVAVRKCERRWSDRYGTLRAKYISDESHIQSLKGMERERTRVQLGCATSIILEPEEDL
jgi:hypothetical protein